VQEVPTDPTWETVLRGTPFEGVPLQNITLQQVIDGTSRANQLSSHATITQTNHQLIMQLPKEMQQKTVTGSLLFYSADNAQKDKNIALQVDDKGAQIIDSKSFMPGNYTAKIRWETNGEQYYSEVPVTIH